MATTEAAERLSPPPPPPVRRERVVERTTERRGFGPVLLLIALLVAGGGFLLFFYLEHEPMSRELTSTRRDLARERRAHTTLDARVRALQSERDRLTRRVAELRGSEEALRSERDVLRAGNEQAQAALAAMREAQDALRARLGAELASGEAQMTDDGDSVSLALDERILFPSGQAELNARGLEVLERVAASITALPDRTVRVEGHTDSTPITGENLARFPSNWELSTARATSVVRFFEAHGIDGDRLAAVGYGEHHPVADNRTAAGRHRNRRIEIVLSRATVTGGAEGR